MVKDDWLTAATTDDALVVELLVRLKHSHAVPSHLAIPLAWGLKQPRSRPFPSFRCKLLPHRITKFDSARCSPSTPLSWTGRFSSSPTSDASDDSTRPSCFSPPSAGSKDTSTNAFAAATTPTSKRSRKKKTLAELKIEEGLLSDERSQLGKELAANKENFKRMKLNLNFKSSSTLACTPGGREKSSAKANGKVGPCHINQSLLMHASSDEKGNDDFLVPDLNMMPCEIEKSECI